MTNSNGNGNRDDELETIRQLLIATANRTESNTQAIEQITPKLDQLTVRVDGIAVKVDQLTDTVNQLAADAEADRRVMFGMLDAITIISQENRRILDYLFKQQQNGNGDQPQA